MGNVSPFPHRPRPLDAEHLAEIRSIITAEALTRDEIRTGPVEVIDRPGPWVAPPGSALSAELERVRAIIAALVGPGRVPLTDGLDVAIEILGHIRQQVKQ